MQLYNSKYLKMVTPLANKANQDLIPVQLKQSKSSSSLGKFGGTQKLNMVPKAPLTTKNGGRHGSKSSMGHISSTGTNLKQQKKAGAGKQFMVYKSTKELTVPQGPNLYS